MNNTMFIFVRHAESIKNLRDVTGGNGENLTKRGIEQVNSFSVRLSTQINTENCNVISSNIIQAKQTAKIIADVLKIPLDVTDELKPADMGIVNGLTKEEIQRKFPSIATQLKLWRNRQIEACELIIPGMEAPCVFWERTLKYLKSICTGGTKIIVCTRSIFVLIYNYVHNNVPSPGGGYKHIAIDNCDTIAFELNEYGDQVRILENITSNGLK